MSGLYHISAKMIADNPVLKPLCAFNSSSYGLHENPSVAQQLADDLLQERITIGGQALDPQDIALLKQHKTRGIVHIIKKHQVPKFFIRWYIQSHIYQSQHRSGDIKCYDYQIGLHPNEPGVPDLIIWLSRINRKNSNLELNLLFDRSQYVYGHASCNNTELFHQLSKQTVVNTSSATPRTVSQSMEFNSDAAQMMMAFTEQHHDIMPFLKQPTLLDDTTYAKVQIDFDHQLQQLNLAAAQCEQAIKNLEHTISKSEQQDHHQQLERLVQLSQETLHQRLKKAYKLLKLHYKRMTQVADYRDCVTAYRQAEATKQRLMRLEPENRVMQGVAEREHQLRSMKQALKQQQQLSNNLIECVNTSIPEEIKAPLVQLGKVVFKPQPSKKLLTNVVILLAISCLVLLGILASTSINIHCLGDKPMLKISTIGVLFACLGGHLHYSTAKGMRYIKRLITAVA